jgi:hypothetical protein
VRVEQTSQKLSSRLLIVKRHCTKVLAPTPHLLLTLSLAGIVVEGSHSRQGTQALVGVMVPSSGNSVSSVRASTGPTPGTLFKSASLCAKALLALIASSRSRSVRSISFSSQRIWARMRLATASGAIWARLLSAMLVSPRVGASWGV